MQTPDLRSAGLADHASTNLTDRQGDPEIWRQIDGFEGRYEVSSLGRVRSWTPAKVGGTLRPTPHKDRYRVTLYSDTGRAVHRYVHRLVADAFLGPRPEGLETRHLNGNPLDNRAANLAYGTTSDNQLDSVRHGTHASARKTHCPQGHPYDAANTSIQNGTRVCRTCRRQREQMRRDAAAWVALELRHLAEVASENARRPTGAHRA